MRGCRGHSATCGVTRAEKVAVTTTDVCCVLCSGQCAVHIKRNYSSGTKQDNSAYIRPDRVLVRTYVQSHALHVSTKGSTITHQLCIKDQPSATDKRQASSVIERQWASGVTAEANVQDRVSRRSANVSRGSCHAAATAIFGSSLLMILNEREPDRIKSTS